jgi:hypothetical protein
MKIALALSGLPRLYPIAAASWGRIIGANDIDVYIHSWDTAGDRAEVLHQLEWSFNPVAVQIDPLPEIDVNEYPDRHWPCIDVYRSLSMWNGISRAHHMVMSSDKNYDIIIRGRMDWYVSRLTIIEFDGIVIPYDADKIPLRFVYDGQVIHGFNDHFAYGPPAHMHKYVNTLNEIPILYKTEGVDYCPENFLAASLLKQKVPVTLQRIEHKLIRG